MILEALPALLTIGVAIGAIVFGVVSTGKQRKAIAAALEGDREVAMVGGTGSFAVFQFATRPPLRPMTMVAAGGGKNNPPRWELAGELPGISARTTVSVSREGVSGKLRETLGMKDVHVGDDAFDKLVCLRGNEPDVVRGVFSTAAVQAATRELFADGAFWRLAIDAKGAFRMSFARGKVEVSDVKRKLLAAVALADALDHAAEAQPLPDPRSSVRTSGVGASSGAPISISVGERR